MIPRRFDRILDDCLMRMDRGESLIDILAVYSKHTEKLKPLLLVAMLSRALPQPVPGHTALRVGKNQMLAEMASMQAEGSFIKPKPVQPPREQIVDRWIGSLKRLQPAYRFAMLSLVVILAGGFFTLSASASGLADNIMQTVFFSFEQVGDLLLVKPSPPKTMGENPIFTSVYDLPETPPDYSGNFKSALVEEEEKGNNIPEQAGEEVQAQIQTRQYSFNEKREERAHLEDEVGVDELVDLIDEDLEKEMTEEKKEEEKDEDKETKEEEKAAKEEEKEEDKAAKEEEKQEKEEEKAAKKEEKEDEKDKDKKDKNK